MGGKPTPFSNQGYAAPSAARTSEGDGLGGLQGGRSGSSSNPAAMPSDPRAWQFIPRVAAYEPPKSAPLPPSPILTYREIIEHPPLSHEAVNSIRYVLRAAETSAVQRMSEFESQSIPVNDVRSEEAKSDEVEVLAAIRAMRRAREERAQQAALDAEAKRLADEEAKASLSEKEREEKEAAAASRSAAIAEKVRVFIPLVQHTCCQ